MRIVTTTYRSGASLVEEIDGNLVTCRFTTAKIAPASCPEHPGHDWTFTVPTGGEREKRVVAWNCPICQRLLMMDSPIEWVVDDGEKD